MQHHPSTGSSGVPLLGERVGWTHLVMGLLFLIHIGATCYFFPPTEVFRSTPLQTVDYPVHTHRVHVYQEALHESGVPWGYDPHVSVGTVMSPVQDVGGKPFQILGALLFFLPPGMVVRLFLFVAVLTFPLWTLLSCRRLGIQQDQQVWILLTLLVAGWIEPHVNGYWHWGLVGFAAASYFSVYVLSLFLEYAKEPDVRLYGKLVLASALLFMLHILGPVIILPALVIGALTFRPLRLKWRLLLFLVPILVVVLNAFWFIPFLLAEQAQNLGHPPGASLTIPPDVVTHQTHTTLAELGTKILNNRLLLIAAVPSVGLLVHGLMVLGRTYGRRVAVLVGTTGIFGLLLWFFGSFVPVVARMQPVRFVVPASVFLSVPVGASLATFMRGLQVRMAWSATGAILLVVGGALGLGWVERLDLRNEDEALRQFIRHRVESDARLFIQSPDGYRYGDYETKAYPLTLGEEVVGSNFPEIKDPPQFLRTMVLGRRLEDWQPERLRAALERWDGTWAFTITSKADTLFESALGEPEKKIGKYSAFKIPKSSGRFLIGEGKVKAQINRMSLTQLEDQDGLVVLKYRYHPGWRSETGVPVHRFPVPEDPRGFVALRNPPESVTLQFDPWAMLNASWPAPMDKPRTNNTSASKNSRVNFQHENR